MAAQPLRKWIVKQGTATAKLNAATHADAVKRAAQLVNLKKPDSVMLFEPDEEKQAQRAKAIAALAGQTARRAQDEVLPVSLATAKHNAGITQSQDATVDEDAKEIAAKARSASQAVAMVNAKNLPKAQALILLDKVHRLRQPVAPVGMSVKEARRAGMRVGDTSPRLVEGKPLSVSGGTLTLREGRIVAKPTKGTLPRKEFSSDREAIAYLANCAAKATDGLPYVCLPCDKETAGRTCPDCGSETYSQNALGGFMPASDEVMPVGGCSDRGGRGKDGNAAEQELARMEALPKAQKKLQSNKWHDRYQALKIKVENERTEARKAGKDEVAPIPIKTSNLVPMPAEEDDRERYASDEDKLNTPHPYVDRNGVCDVCGRKKISTFHSNPALAKATDHSGSAPADHLFRAAQYEIQGDRARALDAYRAAASGFRKVALTAKAGDEVATAQAGEAKARDGIVACQTKFAQQYAHPFAGRTRVCDSDEQAMQSAIQRTRAGESVVVVGKTVKPRKR